MAHASEIVYHTIDMIFSVLQIFIVLPIVIDKIHDRLDNLIMYFSHDSSKRRFILYKWCDTCVELMFDTSKQIEINLLSCRITFIFGRLFGI